MRYYEHSEPEYHEDGGIYPCHRVVSEQMILDNYWEWWKKAVEGKLEPDLITKENCIQDWIIIHWAYYVGDF